MQNLSLSMFLCLFMLAFNFSSADEKEPIYCQYTDEILNKYVTFIEKKYNCSCQGTGGRFLKNVSLITLSFCVKRKASVEEAREILVDATEELLKRINASDKLGPYLSDVPFTFKNTKISFSFHDATGRFQPLSSIAVVMTKQNNVLFAYYDKENDLLEDLSGEPYETALSIVQGKRTS